MDKNNQEFSQPNNPEQPETDLDLDAIMKEFSETEDAPVEMDLGDTVRIELTPGEKPEEDLGDTIRLDNVVKAVKEQLPEEPEEPVTLDQPEEIRVAQPNLPKKEEPYSENWEPEYEQPMGEYIPPRSTRWALASSRLPYS